MAVTNVLFVSETKLKSYTSIHQSVSPDDLQPFILQAQDIYLQNYLGATFYQELQTQITNNTLTIPNKKILDDFIGAMLCNYALYHALPFLKYKVFNKSIMNNDSESGQSIDLEALKFLQNEVRSVAENYTKMMTTFLRNNLTDYPSYNSFDFLDGITPDKGTPYFSGLQTNSSFNLARRRVNRRGECNDCNGYEY
jgi:hypothetical protein